jgi:two-component system chemotaxis response regulator CheY
MTRRVLSVGQCTADHGGISRTLRGAFGAEVVPADSVPEALELLRQEAFALVLVNRVLDADHTPGLELVRQVRADEALKAVPIMLVSNYADAQAEAVAAGAAPGFGKADLGRADMLERVRPFLTGTNSP